MFNYLIRRILYAVPILLGVVLITFVLDNVMTSPDEKASRVLGPKVMGKARHKLIRQHGREPPSPRPALAVTQQRPMNRAYPVNTLAKNVCLFSGRK